MLKRTPLFAAHQRAGARLVEFGGWEMPVHYTSIMDEHLAVRNAAGLFDISHMGEVMVSGPEAGTFLNHLLTNDITKLCIGQGQYTLMCNEQGGVIDDLYAYCAAEQTYLLIVNASRVDADVHWLESRLGMFPKKDKVKLENQSAEWGAVAAQGPKVKEFIDLAFPGKSIAGTEVERATGLKKNELGVFQFGEGEVFIARTGYTGEDGFEIFSAAESIEPAWNQLLEAGEGFGLKPAGLGARDTLRTEMGYPLYGHELDENTTPIEAGLGFFVALDKGDFIGRSVLARQKANGISKKCVAFKMAEKSAPPRPHYAIWSSGAASEKIGEVASGTLSPSLGVGIGMGYVPPAHSKTGASLEIEIRGKRFPAVVAAKPLYRKTA